MTAETDLLPLPEAKPDDPLRADAAFNEGWNACRDSMLAHATAAKDAELVELCSTIEALRSRLEDSVRDGLNEHCRAERLAEALRDARECGNDGDWQSARRIIDAALEQEKGRE